MKTFKALCLVASVTCMLTACDNDKDNLGNQSITFTSSINKMTSRSNGNNWEEGDKVGIYMVPAGQDLASAITENARYMAHEDGTVTPLTSVSELLYPANGSAVDFVAYYPLQYEVVDGIFRVNVTNQEDLGDIDLMYATARNYNKDSEAKPNLLFDHKLSQIYFNIETDEPVVSKSDIYVTFDGINTTADFNLADATFANAANPETVYANISIDGNGTHAAAIVIPARNMTGVTVNVYYKGKKMSIAYPQSDLEPGVRYVHQMKITQSASPLSVGFTPSGIGSWNDVTGENIELDLADGEDFTPVVETPVNTNLALGKTGVQVSSNADIRNRLTDGAFDKMWQQAFAGISNFYVDLEQKYRIDKIVNYWDKGAYAKEAEYFVSVDGVNYVSVKKFTDWDNPAGDGTQTVILDSPVEARFVKCVFDKSSSEFLISSFEIEVYLQAR